MLKNAPKDQTAKIQLQPAARREDLHARQDHGL